MMHWAHLQYGPAGYAPFWHTPLHSTHVSTVALAGVRVYGCATPHSSHCRAHGLRKSTQYVLGFPAAALSCPS